MTDPKCAQSPLLWDIFCQVIDNYGDIGVCWRLAVNLAQRQQQVRLWVDDPSALQWLAPHGHCHVEVIHWHANTTPTCTAGDVLIESFGCNIGETMQRWWVAGKPIQDKRWINLEYLSAESYVARSHLLPSPIMYGAATGWSKTFFYPGFNAQTGGLLRELDLLQRQAAFDTTAWLQQHGINAQSNTVSLFCYEPPALAAVLQQLTSQHTQVLVTAGRAQAAVHAIETKNIPPTPQHHKLPFLPQTEFDHLLWAADCNLVRGEDSLVRALWAGKALVWNIYPQDDRAHHAKLEAFLDWLDAPSDMRIYHQVYNGLSQQALPAMRWQAWQACVQQAREQLLQQPDLVSQLISFVCGKHTQHVC